MSIDSSQKNKGTDLVSVALDQSQLENLLQKGFSFHQQGNFKEAQSIYEQIIKTDPDHFNALQLSGVL